VTSQNTPRTPIAECNTNLTPRTLMTLVIDISSVTIRRSCAHYAVHIKRQLWTRRKIVNRIFTTPWCCKIKDTKIHILPGLFSTLLYGKMCKKTIHDEKLTNFIFYVYDNFIEI